MVKIARFLRTHSVPPGEAFKRLRHEYDGAVPDDSKDIGGDWGPGSERDGFTTANDPRVVMLAIGECGDDNKDERRREYDRLVYPEDFDPVRLKNERIDRSAWLTLFALAAFNTLGRTQDAQHRTFIERGLRDGWWQELAESEPPNDVNPWLDRLRAWSGVEQVEEYQLWRRAVVDLYTIVRWLDEYAVVMRKLPCIGADRGGDPVSLHDVLRPGQSPLLRELGTDAAPLDRTLGIGINWMIREMLRNGTYDAEDEAVMAPYCWMPSGRVRERLLARLLSILDEDLFGEPVLLFTEYKATQALVVNALHRRFGFGSTTFINGDDRLDGVEQASGTTRTISRPRTDAANDFNTGKVRFLVSTEAGGEGIDLQDRCAVLVHVDMPWNPMRLHQRVGRLSRYGQRRALSVYILRNPDTVEARIWGHLSEKLERIQVALSSAMRDQEPEDISQLVIGMAGGSVFDELFADAQEVSGVRLKTWFDQRTATLGGRDVVDTVRDLFESVSRFDFQQVGRDLPRVDLPDLERFFMSAVARHSHRVFRRHAGLEMKTPDAWKARHYAVRDRYDALVFERDAESERLTSRILGVGHVLFDTALDEARRLPVNLAAIEALSAPLLIVSVEDEVTGTGAMLQRMIFGITERAGKVIILRDWELLDALNSISLKSAAPALKRCQDLDAAGGITFRLKEALDAHLSEHAPTLVRPMSWPELLLIPTAGHGNR